MITLLMPLVGAHFNRPAKHLLTALPHNTVLVLEPDPDNPYDSKATKVLIATDVLMDIDAKHPGGIDSACAGTGFDLDTLMINATSTDDLTILGHLPDSDGKVAEKLGCKGNRHVAEALELAGLGWGDVTVRLKFDGEGRPEVEIEIPNLITDFEESEIPDFDDGEPQ